MMYKYLSKMYKLILCSLIFLILVQSSLTISSCDQYQHSTIKSSPQIIDKFIQCVGQLIQNQKIQQLVEIQRSIPQQQEHLFLEALDQQIKVLQMFDEMVIMSKSSCRPNLQWAQNQTHIFIAVKLSHRWDSPPCLRTVQQSYSLKNNTLNFSNVCLMNKVEINFSFNEELFNETVQVLGIKKDGVGTYSITIEKQKEGIWPSLFKTGEAITLWDEVMDRGNQTRTKYLQAREAYQKSKNKSAQSDI